MFKEKDIRNMLILKSNDLSWDLWKLTETSQFGGELEILEMSRSVLFTCSPNVFIFYPGYSLSFDVNI